MTKFLLKKKFLLDFLGSEWKECYLSFNAFTVRDIKERLSTLSKIDTTKSTAVDTGLVEMLKLLKEKYIEGTGVDENGAVVKVAKEDLEEMPVEVISKAIGFLSQGLTGETPKA